MTEKAEDLAFGDVDRQSINGSHPIKDWLIPRLIDHNPWTQSRIPVEVMRDGQSARRFQALQQSSVMSPWSVKMRFDSQL